MTWLWVLIAVVVVVVVVVGIIIAVLLKRRNIPVLSDENDFVHSQKHFAEQSVKLNQKIQTADANIIEIEKEASAVVDGRDKDHEKINGATDWDDLNNIAKDIESRR